MLTDHQWGHFPKGNFTRNGKDTVEYNYTMVQYNMILHTSLQRLNESEFEPTKDTHTSPVRVRYTHWCQVSAGHCRISCGRGAWDSTPKHTFGEWFKCSVGEFWTKFTMLWHHHPVSILDISLKMTDLRLQLHLPGANEFIHWPLGDVVVILYQ